MRGDTGRRGSETENKKKINGKDEVVGRCYIFTSRASLFVRFFSWERKSEHSQKPPRRQRTGRAHKRNTDRMTVGGQAMRQRKREKKEVHRMIVFVSAEAFLSSFQSSLSLSLSLSVYIYMLPPLISSPYTFSWFLFLSIHVLSLSFLLFLCTRGRVSNTLYYIYSNIYLLSVFSSFFKPLTHISSMYSNV